MENLGVIVILLGYTLLWTGVQGFHGNKVSVLEALGLPGASSSGSLGQSDSGSSGSGNQPSVSSGNATPGPITNGGGTKSA